MQHAALMGGGEIWHGEFLHAKFHLVSAGVESGAQKTELLNFPHISEYEPMGISLARLFKTFNTLWKFSCSIVFKICEIR